VILFTNKSSIYRIMFASINAKFISLKSSFSHFISHIVKSSSQKPMFRILTQRIITSMTNKHIFGNFTKSNSPSKSRSNPCLSNSIFHGNKLSISITGLSFNPVPALIFSSFLITKMISLFRSITNPIWITVKSKSPQVHTAQTKCITFFNTTIYFTFHIPYTITITNIGKGVSYG